jgi:hypothetical protein
MIFGNQKALGLERFFEGTEITATASVVLKHHG